MSQDNLRLFVEAVARDESLRASLAALPLKQPSRELDESRQDSIWVSEIIPLAKSKGFDFSLKDVHEYRVTQSGKPFKLADEELDAVVGGEPCRCAMYGYGAAPEGWGACNCMFTGSGLTALPDQERCGCLGYGFGYDQI